MKRVILTIALFFCLTSTAIATEMLMFSMKSCGYCRSFLKEVAQDYNKNPEYAKLLPLRIISMDRPVAPKWFDEAYNREAIDSIVGTPTFIIWDGEERARLIGYNGKDKFYSDIKRFIKDNKSQLEARVGQNKIPFEKETEMTPKYALEESMGKSPDHTNSQSVPKQKGPLVPFLVPDHANNQSVPNDAPQAERDKMESFHQEQGKLPNGVVNSQDIRDHIYKSETMAEIAGLWLGCRGTHTHIINGETIWMPCHMN
jgi:thioredoxin-related protein